MTSVDPLADAAETDIAIIGMACRFPGARDVGEFWENLAQGVESIRQLTEEELLRAGVPRRDIEDPLYVRVAGDVEDMDKFDAAFFGISPRDASVMDPGHRMLLEVAWQALENSGNTGMTTEGRVGVYASTGAPAYLMKNVLSNREVVNSMGEFLVRHTGNDVNFLATRLSYAMDLRGPSMSVQTACSSGLAAVHLARQSLLENECDMALIGGATILIPAGRGYLRREGEILSADGHCRPFDHRSSGTVFSSGAACLVIKRLTDALDNGDSIAAVIKGSAINNDGAIKVSYLAPSVDGQSEVIRAALKSAGLSARSISYVEAHGTGTSVGDPIELTALQHAFEHDSNEKQFCGIGSVKSNIGHLGEVAGLAGIIKTVLALQHRTLPATLGYESPTENFEMADSPFRVISKCMPWNSPGPLRAGVTSLGAGGTNAHLVLEEAPPPLAGEGGRERQLIVLSAHTKTALDQMSRNLAKHLEQEAHCDLGDVAYTLALGRRTLQHRRVLVATKPDHATQMLVGEVLANVATIAADVSDPGVVFTFPGGGAQYARMCFDLYKNEPAFCEALDQCLGIVDQECGPEVRTLLFAEAAQAEDATHKLQRPSLALPALFSIEYALARLFESFGLRPAAYLGHSMGEYVAACLSGVFSVRDGLRLVSLRGRLFERTQSGSMAGVSLSEEALREMMPEGLSIAAVNAPDLCVASGPRELIESLTVSLEKIGADCTPIHIDVAAHSSLLEPILEEFRSFCRTINFKAPEVPIASNLTGEWLTPEQAQDPEYWVQHLRNTVRFSDCVETILKDGSHVFLEMGPGRTLTTLVGAQETKVAHAFNSVRHPREEADDVDYALLTLGKVWAAGAECDWTSFYDGQLRNRVPLPSYPFEGASYWLEAQSQRGDIATEPQKREDITEWFSTVAWDLTPRISVVQNQAAPWLLIANNPDQGRDLVAAIQRHGWGDIEIALAVHGQRFHRRQDGLFEVSCGNAESYRQLLEQLRVEGRTPEQVVMLLGNGGMPGTIVTKETSFLAPTQLAKALGSDLEAAALTFVTENAFSIAAEKVDPMARLSVGPALVIPRELPDFPTRLVDLDWSEGGKRWDSLGMDQLARELLSGATEPIVALRAPQRWVPHLRPTRLPVADTSHAWLADGDVVLITGGLGGIGRVLAQHLSQQHKIRLALLSREALPPRSEWDALLADSATPARIRDRLEWITDLESQGAEVMVVQGDVTDAPSLRSALDDVRRAYGNLHAVIHAAGMMDDGPLQSKTPDQMFRVLAPKVEGTQHLDAAIEEDLKAFIVMSSVASFLGLPGQVDYTAANAFLDAFVEDRQRRKPGRTVAINWSAWRDVGMVLSASSSRPPLPSGRTDHPWLDAWEPTAGGRRYHTNFGVASHWLLGEHRIAGGHALIPGTGFVELARAAFLEAGHQMVSHPTADAVELSQVMLQQPFQISASDDRQLLIEVSQQGETSLVTMASAVGNEVHMSAEVRRIHMDRGSVDLKQLRARCQQRIATRDGFLDQDFVCFGPRWRNVLEIHQGEGESVIDLALDEEFAEDLGTLAYHPALLDMATGGAQRLIPGFEQDSDFLVPFGYDRIRIESPVTQRCVSHVRLRPESSPDVAAFDIKIYDEEGLELIVIDGFTMKRVNKSASITQPADAHMSTGAEGIQSAAMQALLREAITPKEGPVAFDCVMAQTEATQVIASSVDVGVWSRKLAREAMRLAGVEPDEEAPSFSRPTLSSDYTAPESGLESELAAIWSKLLGVNDVGAADDFFELGGNSLIAVRLFTRMTKEFRVSVPLSMLFQAPTIRQLCEVMRAYGYEDRNQSAGLDAAVPTDLKTDAGVVAQTQHAEQQPTSSDVVPPILIRQGSGSQALFLVHDGLGEVLLYRSLALLLDAEHPIYGLEPEQLGGRFLHTNIVDMAKAKITRMRTVQPEGPYLLAGLCAGGVIAFEMARQLEDAGEQVLFVGLLDAADVAAEGRGLTEAKARLQRILDLLRPPAGGSSVKHWLGVLPSMAKKVKNWLSYVIASRLERRRNARMIAQQATAASELARVGAELEYLKVYEAAHREHVATGTFQSGEVVLFRATAGNGEEEDIPFREFYTDELLGWQCRVTRPVPVIDVPGGHTSLLQEPHVGALARDMQKCLRSVLSKHAAGEMNGGKQ